MALFSKDKKETKKDEPKKATSMKDMYADVKTDDKKESKSSKEAVNSAYRVLLKPIVSEKASRQQTSFNQYFFAVAPSANKIEIARAVKVAYGIKPKSVSIIKLEGKSRRYGRRIGKRKDWKKAIVTLPKGKSITLYEGV